MEKEGELVL
jgi:hypothetical protein